MQLHEIENAAMSKFGDADLATGMALVTRTLAKVRTDRPEDWRELARSTALDRVRAQLLQDPYTRRGFEKPRGYPGDAVLVDYIYGVAPLPEDTTELGRNIFRWCSESSQAFAAVRARCQRMAELIDRHAAHTQDLRVLSVACGHLREAARSAAVVRGEIDELVALDQDPESLRVVEASTRGLPVRTVRASVGKLIRGQFDLGEFDVIYATGLFDYLEEVPARALVEHLASQLRPGGELVVGNFLQMWESAYIEAFMDWWLVYRSMDDMAALATGLDPAFQSRVEADPYGVIAYLSVTAPA